MTYYGTLSVTKDGASVAPDSTPTVVCYVNGAATADSVTITEISTGYYSVAVTLATSGVVSVGATVTVDSVTQKVAVEMEAASLTSQDVRDAMKLPPSSGNPLEGSLDYNLNEANSQIAGIVGAMLRVETDLDTVDTVVDAIKVKTDTIGAASSTFTTPMTASGDATIYCGQSQTGTLALSWTITDYSGPSLDGNTGYVLIQDAVKYTKNLSVSTADHAWTATVSQVDTTVTVSCTLTNEQTAAVTPGTYTCQVYCIVGDEAYTIQSGTLTATKALTPGS